jgi:cell division protein FtsQ
VGRATTRPRARPRPTRANGVVLRRRAIAIAIVLVVLYGGYMLWIRNLSWFAINEVTVSGATTSKAEIQKAVEQAAEDMTTLHLKDDQLRAAVAQFPTVATVKADTSLPHGLHVTIRERLPVAIAKIDGSPVAVSADGYLLPGLSFDSKQLPSVEGAVADGPVLDEHSAAQAAILGATPEPLQENVVSSAWDEETGGVVVDLDGGPQLRFGDGSHAGDKWKAVVAVLSSEERGSPSYLDISVPDRPVSGG